MEIMAEFDAVYSTTGIQLEVLIGTQVDDHRDSLDEFEKRYGKKTVGSIPPPCDEQETPLTITKTTQSVMKLISEVVFSEMKELELFDWWQLISLHEDVKMSYASCRDSILSTKRLYADWAKNDLIEEAFNDRSVILALKMKVDLAIVRNGARNLCVASWEEAREALLDAINIEGGGAIIFEPCNDFDDGTYCTTPTKTDIDEVKEGIAKIPATGISEREIWKDSLATSPTVGAGKENQKSASTAITDMPAKVPTPGNLKDTSNICIEILDDNSPMKAQWIRLPKKLQSNARTQTEKQRCITVEARKIALGAALKKKECRVVFYGRQMEVWGGRRGEDAHLLAKIDLDDGSVIGLRLFEHTDDLVKNEYSFVAFHIVPSLKNGLSGWYPHYKFSEEVSEDVDESYKSLVVVEFRRQAFVKAKKKLLGNSKKPFPGYMKDKEMLCRTGLDLDRKEIVLTYPFSDDILELETAAEGLHDAKKAIRLVGDCDNGEHLVVERIRHRHHTTIYDSDMDRLNPGGEFLNDSLIDFWMMW